MSKNGSVFKGIIPAIITPFNQSGVDTAALKQLTDRLIEQGVGGLFTCGNSGEWWSMNVEERKIASATVIEAARDRIPIMVHVGIANTERAIELALHAKETGAEAISSLPPSGFFFRQESIWEYFRQIGGSTDLPFYLYHLGNVLTMEQFFSEINRIPTLRGVKFSAFQIDDLIELRSKSKGRIQILSGAAEQLLSTIVNGAEGSICTWWNVFPRLGTAIIDAANAGDMEKARDLQTGIVLFGKSCIAKHLSRTKNLLIGQGINAGDTRAPLPHITDDEHQQTIDLIDELGLREWLI